MSFFCHSCQKRVSATDYVCDECHQDFIEQVEDEGEGNEQQQQQQQEQQQQQQPFPAPFPFPPFFQGMSNGPRQQQQQQMPMPMQFPFQPFYGVPPPFFPQPQPQSFQHYQQMRMQFPLQGMFPAPMNVNVAQMPAGAPMFGPGMMMGAPPVNPMPFQQLFNNFLSVINNVDVLSNDDQRPQIIGDYALGNIETIIDRLFDQAGHRGPPPASKTVVESLEKLKFPAEKIENSTDCAVCKDEFCTDDQCVRLPCQHLFHESCILPWLENRNSCPVCRYALPTEEEINSPNQN